MGSPLPRFYHTAGCQRGRSGPTVNRLHHATQVRILHPPLHAARTGGFYARNGPHQHKGEPSCTTCRTGADSATTFVSSIPARTKAVPANLQRETPATNPAAANVDWKAKFEEQRAHSRKWEQRAKDNSKAAEELQQFKDSQLSEAEKTAKRIKELEAQNAAYAAERQQNEWRAQVSKETGVPASLLHGDSLEAMSANAKAIDQYAHPKPKGMPNQGKTPDGKAAGADERAWANDLFSNL